MMSVSDVSVVDADAEVARPIQDLELESVVLRKVKRLELGLDVHVLNDFDSHAVFYFMVQSQGLSVQGGAASKCERKSSFSTQVALDVALRHSINKNCTCVVKDFYSSLVIYSGMNLIVIPFFERVHFKHCLIG